jgi:hypothetical protein
VAVILATPGPTNTLMATSGAVSGIRHSLHLLLGEIAGYLLAIYAVRLVIGPLVGQFPLLATVLKIAAAIYIIHLAVTLWHRRIERDGNAPAVTLTDVFITTLLNPKATHCGVLHFGRRRGCNMDFPWLHARKPGNPSRRVHPTHVRLAAHPLCGAHPSCPIGDETDRRGGTRLVSASTR